MSNIKVHELAKELNVSSKELLEKITVMGIEAKSHMSVLSDMDVTAVKNTLQHGKSNAETKIVKVAPKKPSEQPAKAENKPLDGNPEKKPQPQNRPVGGENSQRPSEGKPAAQQNRPAIKQGERPAARQGQVNTEGRSVQSQGQQNGQPRPNQGQQSGQPRPNQGQQGGQPRPNQGQQSGQPRPNQGQQRPNQGQQSGQPRPNQGQQGGQPRPNQGQQGGQSRPNQGQQGGQSRPNQGQQGGQSRPNQGGQGGQSRPNQGGQSRPNQGQQGGPARPNQGGPARPNQGQQRPGTNNSGNRNLQKPRPQKHKPAPKPEPVVPEINLDELEPGTKIITVPITVAGFAEQIEKSTSVIIMALMKYGIMANINQTIDEDTVVILGEYLKVPIVIGKVEDEVVEEGIEDFKDKEEDLKPRPPIITVMGHVDHGKTSLLDAIRKTSVTSTESGGITQHIGASEVNLKGQKIVFLDTPGHEAFTAMRARGAHATDIAVLVVAADDSVKPQTVESISHAKAAGVPVIVAINKMDKPGANPDKVKQDLTEHGLLAEEWGGETICVPVSAKSGEGIVTLLEMILLQAEMLELKANPNRLALGTVIEARLDKAKGPVATLLVLNGTLQAGMSVVAGTCCGRIRAMTNFKGDSIRKAGPATAVEILGLTDVPEAGDEFNAVKEDRTAREIAENRQIKLREEVMKRNSSTTLEQLFSQIQEGEIKELNLIIKGDVQGSVGALTTSLEKMKNENVQVKILHTGVGAITESDVTLAATSGAIIIAFNVRPSTNVTLMADREGVEIRTYRVIYNAIDEVEAAMKGMLDPEFKEVVLGKIEIRNTFKVPGAGIIGGAYVLEGKVERNAEIRLVRDSIVVHEGKISSLKRFKDDAKEVAQGYECGIGIENYNDIKEGDIIEAFKMEEIERK